MSLKELLKQQKDSLLKKWFDVILESYPADTSEFLKNQSGFTNPVGQNISQGTRDIFDGLLMDAEPSEIAPFLDSVIRMRAIQDFTPSQAVGFLFLLKKVVRNELLSKIEESGLRGELDDFESRIDNLGLLGFDIFMKCREKLYDIKANELRDRTLWLLKRSNLLTETPDEPGSESGSGSGDEQKH